MNNIFEMLFVKRPLVVNPQLAAMIGLNEAIILQQIKYWIDRTEFQFEGRKWFFKTADDWEVEFPFWSKPTIRRILKSLEKSDMISSRKLHGFFFKDQSNQTLWYTLSLHLRAADQGENIEVIKPQFRSDHFDDMETQHNKMHVIKMSNSNLTKSIPSYNQLDQLLTDDQADQLSTETTSKITTKNTVLLPKHTSTKLTSLIAVQSSEGKKWGTKEDVRVVKWMYQKILMVNPSARDPNIVDWANDIRLMRHALNVGHDDICQMFEFSNRHHFWSTNIQSPRTLRKQWDKLVAQRHSKISPSSDAPDFSDTTWADKIDWRW